ncbi:MAG: hypothetical protein Q4A42_06690 [Tissierellia bacterium]|nr:hypothetical protein [Tissierellia bacterium]
MFSALSIIIEKSFLEAYNGFFYYFQKLPIIGKLVKNRIFRAKFIIDWIFPLSVIYKFLGAIVTNLFFYLYIIGLAEQSMNFGIRKEITLTNQSTFILVTIMLFVSTIVNGTEYLSADFNKYILIKTLGIKPRDFYFAHDIKIYVPKLFGLAIVGGLLFREISFGIIGILGFAILNIGLRMFFKEVYMYLMKNNLDKKNKYNLIILAVSLALFIGVNVFHSYFDSKIDYSVFFGIFPMIIGIFFGTLSIFIDARGKILETVTYDTLKSVDMKNFNEIQQSSREIDVTVKEGKINKQKRDFSKYSGIRYINEIFYHRFKHVFMRKIHIRQIIIFMILIISNLSLFLFKDKIPNLDKFSSEYIIYAPLTVLILGRATYISEIYTKFTFHNMDKKLLRHAFYINPQLLKEAIIFRFKKLLQYHFLIFIPLIITVLSIYYMLGGRDFSSYGILFLSVLATMVFYSFHFLFMYYFFQPFTNDLKIKNPFYSFVVTLFNYVIYILGFGFRENTWFIIGFSVFLFLYIILGSYLVKVYGPKRFKLR